MRKFGFLVALPLVGALLGIAPAAAQPTPEVTAFCDAGLKVDKALSPLFEGKRPTAKIQRRIDAALTEAEAAAPPEVAANVASAAGIVRGALESGREEDFENPTLEQDSTAIDTYRYNSCGYTQLDVTGIDYEFEGLPRTLEPGPVAIRFTDTGAELHELAMARIKTKDSVRKLLRMSEKEQEKRLEFVGAAFAAPGETDYLIADLSKPGRYGVACFLPVGSTSEEAAEEAERGAKEHWQEGMFATIRVKRA